MGEQNNRRTYILLMVFLGLPLAVAIASAALQDEIATDINGCSLLENNKTYTLININQSWHCSNLLDQGVLNITVNNITNVYTNYSLWSNKTINDIDTHYSGDGVYIYNDTSIYYLNETKLNETVQNWTEAQGYSTSSPNNWNLDNISIRNTTNGVTINNSKYALWENRSNEAYYSYPINTTSVKISSNLTSSGKNTLAGKDTLAVLDNSGTSSLVTGFSDDFLDVGFFLGNISSSGIGSVAMGYASGAVNPFIISSGNGSLAGGATSSGSIVSSGIGSLTWGVGAQTNNHKGGINFGLQNIVNGSSKSGGTAMGGGNTVSESYGVAMGFSNNVFSGATNGGIALGRSNTVAGGSSIGFGYNNSASSDLCYLFGKDLVCDSALSATIGVGQNKLFINSTDIIVNGNLTVTQNIKTSGCIIYNGGTLGTCV